MHSCIFQLGRKKVEKEDYIDVFSFAHDYNYIIGDNAVMDYVQEINEKNLFKNFLFQTFELEFNNDFIDISQIDFDNLLKKHWMRYVNNLIINFEDFCSTQKVWEMQDLLNDRYDFYIVLDGELFTFMEFLRSERKSGGRYYFGNILDFHF